MQTLDITVVMASFNRADSIGASIESVLAQAGDIELVVADSSTDEATPALLRAIEDPRVHVVFGDDLGMPVARNRALERASGRFVAFLDDDDVLRPDWARRLLAAAQPSSGLVLGGIQRVDPDGSPRPTEQLGWEEGLPTVFVAGSFLALREAVMEVGGMLEGLPSSHHWELGVRLVAWCRSHDRSMEVVPEPVVDIEVRPPTRRGLGTPLQFYDGMRWVMVRHPGVVERSAVQRARFGSNVGVPAARLGEWRAARRWILSGCLARPTDWRGWVRLAVAMVPPVARRVWGSAAPYPAAASPARRGLRTVSQLAAVRGTSPDLLMLPAGYREGVGVGSSPIAAELEAVTVADAAVARLRPAPVRTARLTVADDGEETWSGACDDGSADAVVLAGVLQRVRDPYEVLRSARALLAPGGVVVASVPDRATGDGRFQTGPPADPRARRQWTADGFHLLLEACELEVRSIRPRPPTLPIPSQRARRWLRSRPGVVVAVAGLRG